MTLEEKSSLTTPTYQPFVEQTTQKYLDMLNNSGIPPMETMQPAEARELFRLAQLSAVDKLAPAEVSKKVIRVGDDEITLFVVKPMNSTGLLPAFMFFHGGGWVIGDFVTYERMVRDLVFESGVCAVFVEYDLAPEARYPKAFHQTYAATKWVAERGEEIGIDGKRLSVAGNSAGGNLATAVALRASLEGGPMLQHQALFWPGTDARKGTASHQQFAKGFALTGAMTRWFIDHYTTDERERNEIFVSPLGASLDQLKGLPPTLIQTAELDVLRDEGEAYARKLDEAGVPVISTRFNGMIHDFAGLNALSQVPASQASLRQAAHEIRRHLV